MKETKIIKDLLQSSDMDFSVDPVFYSKDIFHLKLKVVPKDRDRLNPNFLLSVKILSPHQHRLHILGGA